MDNQKQIGDAATNGAPVMPEFAHSGKDLPSGNGEPNAFEVRRQNRVDRLRNRASKKRQEGEMRLKRADEIASWISPGQPILVGHHSERRHRRDLQRIHDSTSKGYELLEFSNRLEQQAVSAESNSAIFTEDPKAGEKLETRIEELERKQSLMKEVNRRIRSGHTLLDLGIPAAAEAEMRRPDYIGRTGYPDYALKNNNANIRRLKARLEQIRRQKSQPEPEEVEVDGIRLVENVDLNRVQLFFPGKPPEEVRRKLKANGFRWAPFLGCWQRHRSPYASQLAKEFLGKSPE